LFLFFFFCGFPGFPLVNASTALLLSDFVCVSFRFDRGRGGRVGKKWSQDEDEKRKCCLLQMESLFIFLNKTETFIILDSNS